MRRYDRDGTSGESRRRRPREVRLRVLDSGADEVK